MDRFVRALRAAGFPEITVARARLLGHLDRQAGVRLVDLAAAMDVSKQSAAQMVDELVALGLLARQPDSLDARAKRIVFAPRGRLFLAAADRIKRRIDDDLATVLTGTDLERLGDTLNRLRDRLSDRPADR
ncbi:MAG: helix-turn-helix domain-containing protein [Azospirillaceae bacterium]